MAELFSLVTGPNEIVKDANQIFTTIPNKFKDGTVLALELQIEVYANALPVAISMFVERVENNTLGLTFEEAKNAEFQFKMKGCNKIKQPLERRKSYHQKRFLSYVNLNQSNVEKGRKWIM
jgi:hypothetical protein